MAKFTISLPDELLSDLDDYAAQIGESRSGVIREASARYLSELSAEDARQQKAQAVEESLALFERLAAQPSLDGRSSDEILRDLRGPLQQDES